MNCVAFFIKERRGVYLQELIKITYLVNAAVLIEFRGTKLLIDGIYDEKGHCFSNLSVEQWRNLKKGKEEFSNINYLLFTHEHGDHFSPDRVSEYLDYQEPKAIFMPKNGSLKLKLLQQKANRLNIPCALLDEGFCRKTTFKPEKDIFIRAFQTRHLDKIYWDTPHFCYLLMFGEKKILFTGDVDFNYENFDNLQNILLDAVCINPLFYQSMRGKKLFSGGTIQAKNKVVYHIPFAGDDKMQIRRIVEQRQILVKAEDKNTIFFMEKGQVCYL